MKSHTVKLAFLSLRVGRWFEAKAAGWGVLALPLLILILAAVAQVLLHPGWGLPLPKPN